MKKFILPALLLLPGFCYGASRVFYDNFDNGKYSPAWSYNTCSVVTRAADGGSPHQGPYMLQCNWNGVVAWNSPYSKTSAQIDSWPYQRETFLRMWLRLDRDMDNKDGAKMLRLGFGGGCDLYIQRDPVTQSGGTHEVWSCNNNILLNSWGAHKFEDRQWHKFEIYIKHDTNGSGGAIKTWEDGILTNCCRYPYSGRTTSNSNTHWYPLNLISNWSNNSGWEHDANNHIYFNQIEIFSDIGTGTVGNLYDATIRVAGTQPVTPTDQPEPTPPEQPSSDCQSPQPEPPPPPEPPQPEPPSSDCPPQQPQNQQ